MSIADRALMLASGGERLEVLLDSYCRLTGGVLANDTRALWESKSVVLAHDTGNPPRYFYGNHAALTLFGWSARDMLGLPSYRSAEPDVREERAAMFARLEEQDVVTGYGGVRVAADGSRFRISNAVIWNITTPSGERLGQAAAFDEWIPLAG